ncbi:hypothetical protein K438DRAFT_1944174 [Mycena galopus ATCC 62051]|nr:hypothetical protein K438DRAFT_1944174 [Mycena galopus ATCC 62051]
MDDASFLATVEGEIAFFRAIMRARPVGIHRHFHVLNIRNGICKDTGHTIAVQSVWDKLRALYDMDALEQIDLEVDGYESRTSDTSHTPTPIRSPSPNDNLAAHPFFRDEYALPYDTHFDALIAARRIRDTPSPPSLSPPPAPSPLPSASSARPGRTRASRAKGRSKSKLTLAGLVGGDSDSSALTQESGDEGGPTPRDSVTITEGGTEYGGTTTQRCAMFRLIPAQPPPQAAARARSSHPKKRPPRRVVRAQARVRVRAARRRRRKSKCLGVGDVELYDVSGLLSWVFGHEKRGVLSG